MEIITKAQAVERGLLRYFDGVPCRHGHIAERYVKKGACIQCNREKALKNYYADKDSAKARMAEWRLKNRDRKIASDRARYQKNREAIREKVRASRSDEGRAKEREYARKRLASNPLLKLSARLRSHISTSMSAKRWAKHKSTQEILGCSFAEFKAHLEKQFLPGMTWDRRSDWHIDHIVPVSTARSQEELLALFHFTNLRPLWAKDNISKLNRITHLI